MDIERIYSDYSVPLADSSDKHFRDGWINTACPFCTGNPGFHLGYNVGGDYFYCWRCGSHPVIKSLSKVLGISYSEASRISKNYHGRSKIQNRKIKVKKLQFKLPFSEPLTKVPLAIKYMKGRGFSEKEIRRLERRFKLRATKFGCIYDNMDLSFRIIAPIFFKGEVVSWQSRDVTGTSEKKYLACPKNRETMDHKTVLYNDYEKEKTVLVVEGVFDVWKCYLAGFKAVSPFGVEYTYPQLKRLLRYKKLLNFLDPDKAGKKHAKGLRDRVIFAGGKAETIKHRLNKDPGDMTITEIKNILKEYEI